MPEPFWVFDTVSVGNFLQADAAGLLALRYGRRALITPQVYDELSGGMRSRPALRQIDGLLAGGRIKLITLSVSERTRYASLLATLGRGEASCIAVAGERGFTVVSDDRAARTHCAELGLRVTGTIGILKDACLEHQLSPAQADHILGTMVAAGFYSPVARISDLL
jgi:predicted nucleic acid-binding protein